MARRTFQTLFDSYEDRVAKVADRIGYDATRGTEKASTDHVRRLAHIHSQNELEGRLGGQAHAHLMKDAMAAARPVISSHNRSLGARARHTALKNFHHAMAQNIHGAIGSSYPDGDPIDLLARDADRAADEHGVKDYDHYDLGDHLDKAAQINGYKSYHHQLHSTWEEHGMDQANPEHVLVYHKDDPDGLAKHAQHDRTAREQGKVTKSFTGPEGLVNVIKHDPFDNPWS